MREFHIICLDYMLLLETNLNELINLVIRIRINTDIKSTSELWTKTVDILIIFQNQFTPVIW